MRNIKINWRYNIGQRLIEYNTNGSLKKDITIIDRKIIKKSQKTKNESLFSQNIKYYKYKCNICGFDCGEHYRNQKYNKELWIIEAQLIIGCGCGVCCNSPQTVVEGINDIPTTAPWMVKYFQGGYDEAKLYNKSSGKKIYPVCPDCGRVKDKKISINTLYSSHSISCYCSDCIPYGEKIMSEILNQLRLNFQTQLTKSTFKWCNKYRYDFYFEYKGEQYICEVHGMQHYEENTNFKMSLKEVQENDRLKKELALNNGVKEGNYIVIDCRKSELDFIKQNILDSDLANIFDFSKIDWIKAEEFTCSSLVKIACDLNKNNNLSVTQIIDIMGYSRKTIINWLKKGNVLNWCMYAERTKINKKNKKIQSDYNPKKKVEVLKDGISMGIFDAVMELERQSEKIFGIKLKNGNISMVCNGKRKTYKGFTFRYI